MCSSDLNKKTFLYLKAIENGTDEEKKQLEGLFSLKEVNAKEKVETVKSIYNSTEATTATRDEIERYTKMAFETLKDLNVSDEKKMLLQQFGKKLMNRNV